MTATRYDNDTRKLMSVTDIYSLQQLITEPTRITPTSAFNDPYNFRITILSARKSEQMKNF